MTPLTPQSPDPRVTNALDVYVERINGLRPFAEDSVCRKCNGGQPAASRFCQGPPPGWRPLTSSLALPREPVPMGSPSTPTLLDLQYGECVGLAGVEHMHRSCPHCTAHWVESTPETVDQALKVTDTALALAAEMATVRAELRFRALGLLTAAADSRASR
jgi:hypothetical protein